MTFTSGTRSRTEGHGFRPELQALRALAVTLVVSYHLGPLLVPGGYIGVDVFFVISGYLMTSHLNREFAKTGRIQLWRFYARRVRRLLPAAFLVLLATLAGTVAFVPTTLWAEIGRQIALSALYVENWALASNATIYSASDASGSPVQHYWSLSVEEQFYLIWPIVMMIPAFLLRSVGRSRRPSPLIAILAVTLVSLACSVVATAYLPSAAYFITPTRIWELACGGLLSLLANKPAPPPRARVMMSVTGVTGIIATAFLYSSTTPFPGYAALIPVAATCLVIIGGDPPGQKSTFPLFRIRPVQYLGDVSYSLYLWHWPLIIIAPYAVGGGQFRPPLRVAVLVVSLLLASGTKHVVEDRFRGTVNRGAGVRSTRAAFVWVVAGVLVVALPAGFMSMLAAAEVSTAVEQLASDRQDLPPGLGAASIGSMQSSGRIIPSPLAAAEDSLDRDAKGTLCQESGAYTQVVNCHFGNPDSPHQIALVGDSHAGQWLPALVIIANARGWGLTTYLRGGCPLSLTYPTRASDSGGACIKWVAAVLPELTKHRYERVFVGAFSGSSYNSPNGFPGISAGMAAAWRRVTRAGSSLIAIRDDPDPQAAGLADVPTCVDKHMSNPSQCDTRRKDSLLPDPQIMAVRLTPGARLIDLTRYFCPTDCRAVAGGALIYRDGHHLTRTYVDTLAPYIEADMGTGP